jgi:excisionase family DNA binding protein
MIEQLLTPNEVSEILKISCKAVHKLCRDGKLDFIWVNNKERRFTQEDVQTYIEAQAVRKPAIDKKPSKRLPCPKKGGAKSFGNGANLRKEMKQWR